MILAFTLLPPSVLLKSRQLGHVIKENYRERERESKMK